MPLVVALALAASIVTQTPGAPLRIVVIEGEGAVNIIQQKTAVRPLVEVRDRNNVPVSGATVTFALNGQPAAFANGATTLTVTTNAQGQAAAAGFNAIRPGAVQIQVSAAHQGQTAAAMISQTNFATAAAATAAGVTAATAGGAAGAGGGAATGATTGAAAGGGISATTIAIIGAAVGGGAVVATQVTKSSDSEDGNFDIYTGPFTGQYVFVNTGGGNPPACTSTRTMAGTLTIDLSQNGTGTARLSGTMTEISNLPAPCIPNTQAITFNVPGTPVTGGPSAITFSYTSTDPAQTKVSFTGALSGTTITGTLTVEQTTQTSTAGQTFNGRGSGTAPVTLSR